MVSILGKYWKMKDYFQNSYNSNELKDFSHTDYEIKWDNLSFAYPLIIESLAKTANDINNFRLNIRVETIDDFIQITKLLPLLSNHQLYTFRTSKVSIFRKLKDKRLPAYIDVAVKDWDTFNIFLNMQVSDILIDGPLVFSMDKIRLIKNNNPQLKIRVNPLGDSAYWNLPKEKMPELIPSSSFIRPQDVEQYKIGIDIFDFNDILEFNSFLKGSKKVPERYDFLVKWYSNPEIDIKDYDLRDLLALDKNAIDYMPNLMLSDNFCSKRLNCGQICRDPRKACHFCYLSIKEAYAFMNFFRSERSKSNNDE